MVDDMRSSFGIFDDGSTKKTIDLIREFDKRIGQSEQSVNLLTDSFEKFDKTIEKVWERQIALAKEASDVFLEFERQADGSFKAVKAFRESERQLESPEPDFGEGGLSLGRQVGAIGGQLGSLGLDKVGDTVSQFGKLSDSIGAVGENAGGLTTGLGAAGIALTAVTIGIGLFQSALDGANEEFNRSLGVTEEVARVTQQGSDAAAARVEQAKREIEIQKQLREEALATAKQQASSFQVSDLFDVVVTDLEDTANEAAKTAADIIESEQAIIDKLEGEFGDALRINTAEAEKAADALNKLADQERELSANRQQALDDLAFDRARRDARAAEDQADADARLADQRAEAAMKDAKRLQGVRQDAAKQQAKTLETANASINKLLQDSYKERVRVEQDFNKAQIEAQNTYNERRAQIENDFRNAQFDAVQDNDIIAALRAQRARDEEQTAERNAAQKEAQQRQADRQQRLAELKEEQQQRIAEIQTNLAIEVAEQKKALREKLALEAESIAERKRLEDKADKDRAKQEEKRRRRQAEDDALADERSQRAFEQQLKRIEDQKRAEQQALKAIFKTIENGGKSTVNAIGQANQAVINATGQVAQQLVNGIAGSASGRGIPGLAEGGIVTRPTLAFLGENYKKEAVIPLERGNLPNGMGQSVTINLTTADIATGQQVAQAIRGAMTQYSQVDIQVLADSLAG